MTHRHRSPVLLLATLAATPITAWVPQGPASAPAPAQSRPVTAPLPTKAATWDEVRAQLAATDHATLAWGAWHARRLGLTQALPDLQRVLDALQPLPHTTGRDLCARGVLDALIGLTGQLGPTQARAWWDSDPGLRDLVLILVAGDVTPHLEFLRTLPEAQLSAEQWRVRIGLLLPHRPRELAAELVGATHLTLEVVVNTPGHHVIRGEGMGHTTFFVDPDPVAQRFPPRPTYTLKPPDADTFATGPEVVAWRRSLQGHPKGRVLTHGPLPREPEAEARGRDDFRCHALAWLARPGPGAMDAASVVRVVHDWQGPPQYLAAVADGRLAAEAWWRDVTQRLAARQGLDPARIPAAPIRVVVYDERQEPTAPLPALPRR